MWAPLAQLQPQLAAPLFLPEWATSNDLELLSQGYEGGNVTIQEAPVSFSHSLISTIHFSPISLSMTLLV